MADEKTADEKIEEKKDNTETNELNEKKTTNIFDGVEKKGEWGLLNIYSSPNNIIMHLTDITGRETLAIVYGGQMVKADKDKPTPYSAMKGIDKIAEVMNARGIKGVDVRVRGPGGHDGPLFPGKASQAAIKQLVRRNIKIGRITNVTPIPFGGCRPSKSKRRIYMS
ncbi:MAG: 30S ribosomal protein S11 [Candidatus Altarchaeaceae archaeon]